MAAVLFAGGLNVAAAQADTAPVPGQPETVSADGLPTVQVDGVVWKTAIAGNTVFAVGKFGKARPAGAAAGSSEVARANILAFDITTGNLLPFNHALNAQALTVKVSPDGTKVYVGGDFTTVDGIARNKVAAFNTSDGSLDTSFAPSFSAQVRALAVTNSTVYAGGNFFNVNGSGRTRLAAVSRTGTLLPWKPVADDNQVEALAVSPTDTSRVIVGGRFQKLNGQPQVGVGAVDATTGATVPWSSRPVPTQSTTLDPVSKKYDTSWVTDLFVMGDTVYGSADGEGGHWYDGRFAAKFSTGDLVWLDNCYGATYGIYATQANNQNTVYSVSHAHDCTSLGAFPDTSPTTWHRTLAETTYPDGTDKGAPGANSNYSGQPIPKLLHWFPTLGVGSVTGQYQAAWSVTGNGQYVVEGGEFPSVNGTGQQGLVRFAVKGTAPNKVKPVYSSSLTPSAVSLSAGTVRVSWPATWDPDNATLQYDLYRDSGTTPVFSTKQTASSWTTTNPSVPTGPNMGFVDSGLPTGSSHTYRLKISDPFGNNLDNLRSPAATVSSTSTSGYAKDVAADGASSYWRLGDAGTKVYDYAGFTDAAAGTGVTQGASGAIAGDADKASTFDGTTNGLVASSSQVPVGDAFSVEAWVKTTSTAGGKIVGYGDAASGTSNSYDRHLYMDGGGRVFFGVYPGQVRTVNSGPGLNDGAYHHVVGTLDPVAGMSLYVDGRRVGYDAGTKSAQQYPGFWRIGGDNMNGWPNATQYFLAGTIDEVAVYPTAISPDAVVKHYVDSGRTSPVPAAPSDSYGKAVYQRSPDLYWRLGEASGTTAVDASRNSNDGTYYGGVTLGQGGALTGVSSTAASFDGTGHVASNSVFSNPTTYSEEIWFNTTSTAGGKLIGFGNVQDGDSNKYDRHVYMQQGGQISFGVWTGTASVITTPGTYSDGHWHQVVATQSGDGMKLYVDGALVGTDPQSAAQAYDGYWRVGGDSSWGGNNYFTGLLDEAAVYPVALTGTQVAADYNVGTGTPPPNQAPTASMALPACSSLVCSFDGTASSDSDGTVASYAWDFGDGSTGTGATPSHTYAAAGTYTATLTVTDNQGATSPAVSRQVSVTRTNQAPVAQFTSSCTSLSCSFNGTASSDPDGTVAGYAWTFGDSTTGSGASPTHTYVTAGSYSVTLTVTDNDGATSATTKTVAATAPAPSTTTASDTFTRSQTAGWGTSDSGQSWTASSTTPYTVSGGVGSLRLAGAGSGTVTYLSALTTKDTDTLVTVSPDKVPVGGAAYGYVLGRRVQGSGDYRAKVFLQPNGAVALQLSATSSTGAETALSSAVTATGTTYSAGTGLQVRLQVTGASPTALRAKVWAVGTTEPAAWLVTATDTRSELQVPGSIGLGGYLSGAATNAPVVLRFDDLAVRPTGA